MNRFLFLILFSAFVSTTLHAQLEHANWYFGTYSAVSFISGAPVNLPNGSMNMLEGSSCISDSNGNLLFYTNGMEVWNANHTQMPNGSGLNGGQFGSSVQEALVVPDPADTNLFFIFTTSIFGGVFCYSKVDMTLDGGLGDVYELNTELLASADEKVTAIKNTDGSYWVVSHAPGSYYAYPLTTSGLGSPVVSNVGIVNGSSFPYIGALRISPQGNYITNTQGGLYSVEIASFDMTTGVVSNPFSFEMGASNYGYSQEFSASGNMLYVGNCFANPALLYQFDMTSGDSTTILASAELIFSGTVQGGYLQIAPDNKIYRAQTGQYYLGVINDPEVPGTGCNYVENGFTLNTSCQIGLPNFPNELLETQTLLPNASFSSDQNICENTCIDFTNQSTNSTSYEWIFDGGSPNTSTATNPNVCYATAGSYDVTLISSNGADSDTLTLTNYIIVTSATAPTLTQSNDTLFSSTASSYQWYHDGNLVSGATNSFFVAPTSGLYTVEITDANGCTTSTSVNIELFQQPTAIIQPFVTKICPDSCIAFGSNSTNAVTYEWYFDGGNPNFSTDESPTGICYATSGNYDVTLIVHNGPYSDTSTISNLIEVYPAPSPTITQSNDTLSVLPVSGATYQWQLDNTNISGATNDFYVASSNGVYTVIVTNGVGCTGSDETKYFDVVVETIESENDFTIYPNPADESITIRLGRNEIAQLKLYNTLGQLLQNDLVASQTIIDVSNFSNGVYYITLQSENDTSTGSVQAPVTKRMIVNHK